MLVLIDYEYHHLLLTKNHHHLQIQDSVLVDVLNQEGVIETGESQQVEFVRDLTIEYDIPNQIQTSNNNSSTGGGY